MHNSPRLIIQQSRIDISGKARTSLLSQCSRTQHSKCMQNKTAVFINSGIHKPADTKMKNQEVSLGKVPIYLNSLPSLFCAMKWGPWQQLASHLSTRLPQRGGSQMFPAWLAGSLRLLPRSLAAMLFPRH